MTEAITDIISAIDTWTATRYASLNLKLYGFSELMKKTAGENSAVQYMPVTIPNRDQVSLDDRYNFITWMRWVAPVNYTPNEDWGFGKNEARFAEVPIRLVLAHRVELGESIVFDFISNFPSKFSIPGFKFVFTDARPTIDPDHEGIYSAELSDTVYEKHRFTWNIYVLNLSMQFIVCEETEEPTPAPEPEPEPEPAPEDKVYVARPIAPTFSDSFDLIESVSGNGIAFADTGGKTDLLIASDYNFLQLQALNGTYRLKSKNNASPAEFAKIGSPGNPYAITAATSTPNVEWYDVWLKDAGNLVKYPVATVPVDQKYQGCILQNGGFGHFLINESVAGKNYGGLSIIFCLSKDSGGEFIYGGHTINALSFFMRPVIVQHCYSNNSGREGLQVNGAILVQAEKLTCKGDGINLGEGIGQNNCAQLQNVFDGYLRKSIFLNFVSPLMIATNQFTIEDCFFEWTDPTREIYIQDMVANGYLQFVNPGGTLTIRRCTFYNPNYTLNYLFRLQEENCNVIIEDCILPASAVTVIKDERSSTPFSLTISGTTFTNSPNIPVLADSPDPEYSGLEEVVADDYYYNLGYGHRTP